MTKEEKLSEYQQLIKAMIELQKELPTIKKDAKGQLGNRVITYANLESIWDALHPLLVKNGLWFSQNVITIDGSNYLESILRHESGCEISSRLKIEFPGSEIKQFGASITYYRRYAIQAMFCIQCTDNNKDEAEVDPEKSKEPIVRDDGNSLISEEERKTLALLINGDETLKGIMEGVNKSHGYKSSLEIQKKNYKRYLKAIIDYKAAQN